MGDKDQTIRKIVKQVFDVLMYIWSFHSQQAFRNAIVKMDMKQDVKNDCLQCFHDIVHSKTKKVFDLSYAKFETIAPAEAIEYLKKKLGAMRKRMGVLFGMCSQL